MSNTAKSAPRQYGAKPVAVSRYFALYIAQLGWILLGMYLMRHAYWPSTCVPEGIMEIYGCSYRLAENRGWVESALMTWLWSSPILLALDVMRRFNKPQRR